MAASAIRDLLSKSTIGQEDRHLALMTCLDDSQLSFDLFALGIPSHFDADISSGFSQEDGDSAARADSRVSVVNHNVDFAAENCGQRYVGDGSWYAFGHQLNIHQGCRTLSWARKHYFHLM
jgi:hypothetical protein